MPLLEVHNRLYTVNKNDVAVSWGSYDFSQDVAGILDPNVRTILSETGVMYVPTAKPAIRVSHLLQPAIQGLSALHEELCMDQKTAPCPKVEEMVLDSIDSPSLQAEFIATRLRLFGALCLMDQTNELFATTQQLLLQRSEI